jgi:hypothetical protein
MSYSIFWRSPGLQFTGKQTAISVPAGSVVSNAASLRLTGKGASNYGKIQQENQLRLLENFAGDTPPDYPTVGQTWYDTANVVLKVCISTAPFPVIWQAMNSTQITDVGDPAPMGMLGDMWFQRTGSQSGILYTYTGLGRYPEVDWDAYGSGYWPTINTTTLAFRINESAFNAVDFGEMYICGYTGVLQDDVNGSILIDSVITTVPKGVCYTNFPSSNAYVLWDTTNTLSSVVFGSGPFFQCRQLDNGQWQYDNNQAWLNFNPVPGMFAIGLISVSEVDDNDAVGVSSGVPFTEGLPLEKLASVPETLSMGAVGGWSQVWPTVDISGSRYEYDYLNTLIQQFIGDENGSNGSGAFGKSISYLTNFHTLDASLRNAWASGSPIDQNVFNQSGIGTLDLLKIEPNSGDWDLLLSAARYALNRLELPVNMYSDISPVPFVQDGRPAPDVLYSFSPSDVRFATVERTANTRYGSVSISRFYQETVNVLNSALLNKYLLKGMLGTSGTNPTFGPNVSIHNHASFTAPAAGTQFQTLKTHTLTFNFDDTYTNRTRFFTSGEALELVVAHSGSSTVSDIDLKTLTDNYGRVRMTYDACYIMSGAGAVTASPSVGFSSLNSSSSTLIASFTSGAAVISYRAQLDSNALNGTHSVILSVDVTSGGSTTGVLAAQWNWIGDDETYNNPGPVRVYPEPISFNVADKTGYSGFV